MDIQIFKSRIECEGMSTKLEQHLSSNDLLGSFLVFHLCCEELVESFIYNVCQREDFFYDSNGNRIFVDFYAKLKIAQKLGLPEPLYKAISKINRFRNENAHNFQQINLHNGFLQSIIDLMDSYTIYNQNTKIKERLLTDSTGTYSFNEVSDKAKLLFLFLTLSQKTLFALENL